MSMTFDESDVDASLDSLEHGIELLRVADLDQLSAEDELRLLGRLEVLRRRLDAGTDRAAAHLDRSGALSSTATRPPRAR